MARTWKPSKARVKRDIAEALNHFEALTVERHRVIGFDKPVEYREKIIDAACLMMQARDLLQHANSYKPNPGEPWESEGAIRNYKFNKKESENTYQRYLELKEQILQAFPFSSEAVTRDIKASYKATI